MALNEEQLTTVEQALAAFLEEKRPPEHIRDQVDLSYRLTDQTVVLFEIRATWQDKSSKVEVPFAKITFVKSTGIWKIYWMRGNLKWHRYKTQSEVHTIEFALEIIKEDEHHCFFG